MLRYSRLGLWSSLSLVLLLSACAVKPDKNAAPLPSVAPVNLPQFMGDWYVIAYIPTRLDADAYNQVERYELDEDGSIATTFTFRQGGFDGKLKTYTPRGYIVPGHSNALWGMQFVWPFRAEYRIAYLAPDYSTTIIARSKRDLVWLMARSPQMSEADYTANLQRIAAMGYDLAQLVRVPQRWPATP